MSMGLLPSEKEAITREAWKYVYAGAMRLVWSLLDWNEEEGAYPVNMETLLDIVETITSEVPTEVRTAISVAATPFCGDLPSISLAHDACLRTLSDIPLALRSFTLLIERINSTMYVCLPRKLSEAFRWYRGVSKGPDPTSSSPLNASCLDVKRERTMEVNDTLAYLTGGLVPQSKREVFTWSRGVTSDTDVRVGMVMVRRYQQSGGNGKFSMSNQRPFYMNGSERVCYDEETPATEGESTGPSQMRSADGGASGGAHPVGRIIGGRRTRNKTNAQVVNDVDVDKDVVPGLGGTS